MRASVLVLLAASACLYAQRYNFKFYGEDEGLENLGVHVVLQDRTGFIWVGTQNGLYRYDGSRFIGFGKADGLPGARVESLHESGDGTLWVGTQAGVARKKGDRFEAVSLGVARGVAGREGIASDAAGHLYFATERGLVTGSNGSPYKLIAAPRGEASSVYVDGTGAVWFGCGSNLCRFENGEAREIGSEEGLPGDGWDAILGDRQGNLWVRSERSLYMRANGSRRFEPARAGLPESTNTYPTLALDPAGRLLVPTYRGLARQTEKGWEILEAQQGLTTNDISAVMQDREGSIWLGLLGSGLARWLGYNEWQGWSDREGLSRESIWSIARDASGRLWVGTQFGLNYADDHGERLEWRKQALEGVEMIRSLAAGSKDALWIGAWPGGLRWLNTRTGETRSIGSSQGLSSNYVRHVMVDREERVWVSTRDGLFRAAAGSMKFDSVIPGETFHMTMMDRTGAVWAAGAKGLMRFAGEQVTRFDSHSGLKSDVVAHLAEDPDGSLWIGYYDAFGLTRLTFLHGGATFKHFTTPDGLRSDKSLFLGFDARGWLWAGSDHGVDVFDRTRWRHYGRSDGMIWDDCNTNGFMADADGGVWVGTSRGLSHFRPASAEPVSVPPPVVFTSVKFGDQSVEPASAGEIPYKRNSLQVRYAALTFAQESSVLFRYRLAGVQRNWTETTHRELDFPKLPAGQFTLEVMARNKQGTWTVAPARLDFQILTPWFLTWWFQMGNVLLALALGVGMWHRRTRRLEEERQRLEAAVTERTRELSLEKQRVVDEKARTEQQKVEIERLLTEAQQASRSKSEFLANMSHEIRTPMNGILGMTDMALAMPLLDEQREYLETARLSAKSLLTVLNDALDFSKIEAGHMELSPVNFSLRRCVHETAKMFSVAAAEKKLSLDVRFDESVPDHVIGDPDRLRQVLLNLLGNAMKFTADGGVLIVVERDKCEGDELLVHFAVADTGIGIPRDKQELIFEAFRQADGSTTRKYGGTGLGLAICLRLIHLMGGTVRVESEPDQGSTFHFTAKFVVVREPAGDVRPTDTLSLQNMLSAVGTATVTPQSLHVLLAEDNLINQRVAMRLLEKRGHRVALATTGHEVLDWLKRQRFDLILMDVQMPEMDGLEATMAIRENEKQTGGYTPIVALTAHTMAGDRERCLQAGMDSYVNKPIEPVRLLEVVESTAAARLLRKGAPVQKVD